MTNEFKPFEILRVLTDHAVEYIVIGGAAAYIQGSPIPTQDIDIVPRLSRANFERLSAALIELNAEVRVDGARPVPFNHDATSIAGGRIWNLWTRFGALDITQEPSGTRGYEDLRADAVTVLVVGSPVLLASLTDIIRSKEAAGRDKDRAALPILRKLAAKELKDRRPQKT